MTNLKKAKAKDSAMSGASAHKAPTAASVSTTKTKNAEMVEHKNTIIGLGELLWDVFPNRKELGGAPANFAYMVSLLGEEGVVASRVGRDRLGNSAARRLARLGLSQESLQLDTEHPTGTVQITLAEDGQPKFEFPPEVAWDYLEFTPQWQALASRAAAVCFGSLAQRAANSRKTIHAFLQALPAKALKVFDVNLRQEFFTAEILRESAQVADIMKVNHEELLHVAILLGYKTDSKDAPAKWLLEHCNLKLVCVTEGPHGSFLMAEDGLHKHPGFPTEVVDTVGAGDAFTAALVHHYLRGASLDEMNDAANRMGSWVASQAGATPKPNVTFLKTVRHRSAQPLD